MSTALRVPAQQSGSASAARRDWKQNLGIQHGEWLLVPKAQLAADYTNTRTPAPQRVYALLQLHSYGYQQPVAVYFVPNHSGKGAPEERILTPAMIGARLGLDRQNTRRALARLEQLGKIERQPIPDKRTGRQRRIEGSETFELLRDRVQIYVHPKPLEPTPPPPKPSPYERYLRTMVPRPARLRDPEVRRRYEAMLQTPELQAAAWPAYEAYQARIDSIKAARRQSLTDYQQAILVVKSEEKKAHLVVTSRPGYLMDERTTEIKSTTETKPDRVSRAGMRVPVSECNTVKSPPADCITDAATAQQIKNALQSELNCELNSKDPLLMEFARIASQHGHPHKMPDYIRYLCRIKSEAKYKIWSAGAVLHFARRGFGTWTRQHRSEWALQPPAAEQTPSSTPEEKAEWVQNHLERWATYEEDERQMLRKYFPEAFGNL